MKTQRITVVNPLMDKFTSGYTRTTCWAQFVEDWEKANNPWQWESLLHIGYDMSFETKHYKDPDYKPIDRLTFYMSCADGWLNAYNTLHISGECDSRVYPVRHEKGRVKLTAYEKREMLAEKAMKMICLYEFKLWVEKPLPDWNERDQLGEYFTSADLLPALIHFFSDTSDSEFRHYNFRCPESWLKLSHIEGIAPRFVLKLIETILNWSEDHLRLSFYSSDEDEIQKFEVKVAETKARFDVAKTWATEMLVSMGELDRLKKLRTLESVVLSTLRKIESQIKVKTQNGERVVRGHKEALDIGFEIAWFLEQYFTTRGLNFDGTPIEKAKPTRRARYRGDN